MRRLLIVLGSLFLSGAAMAAPLTDSSTGEDFQAASFVDRERYAFAYAEKVKVEEPTAWRSDLAQDLWLCITRLTSFNSNAEALKADRSSSLTALASKCLTTFKTEREAAARNRHSALPLFAQGVNVQSYLKAGDDVRSEFVKEAAQRLKPQWNEDLRTDLSLHLFDCLSEQQPKAGLALSAKRCVSTFSSDRTLDGEMTGEDYVIAARDRQIEYVRDSLMFSEIGASRIQLAAKVVFVDNCLKTALSSGQRGDREAVQKLRRSKLSTLLDTCLVMRELGR